MSFLYPLFLIGLAAVVVPVLLHLARRRTQQEQPWSSLRFLRPAPPRLERRRRIEHWLLLALRVGAVALLAGAFARPFFTRAMPGLPAASGTRTLLLIDTSASMRREGLWPTALAVARDQVSRAGEGAGAGSSNRLAILTFDGRVTTVLSFEQWASAPAASRRALAETRLTALAPGWGATDLGAALVAAAEAVVDDQAAVGQPARMDSVILLSDLAEGARLTALGPAEWPAGLGLRVIPLTAASGPNLGLQLVPSPLDGPPVANERVRVRVLAGERADGPGASSVRARLRWQDNPAGGDPAGAMIEVTMPAGETRVLDAPPRPPGPATLVLEGDAHGFDNQLAVAPAAPAASTIIHIGNDQPTDATGPLYFLGRAFPRTRTRAPQVQAFRPGDPALPASLGRADLVVLTEAPPQAATEALRAYLARGRTVLFVPRNAEAAAALAGLTGQQAPAFREAPAGRDAVLTGVDLRHPLLAPFADGRSADFTRIRFWKRRQVDPADPNLAGARVLARFDDGSPAWFTVTAGRGLVFVMTSGFGTADSQLALSSKLVPLLWGLLDASSGAGSDAGPLPGG